MKTKLFDRPTFKLIMSIISGLLGLGFIMAGFEQTKANFIIRLNKLRVTDISSDYPTQTAGPLWTYLLFFAIFAIIFIGIVIFSVYYLRKITPSKLLNVCLISLLVIFLSLWFIFHIPPTFIAATMLMFWFSYVMAQDALKGWKKNNSTNTTISSL